MKLVIFGATGFSGQVILKLALSKGFQVTVLVRNQSAITIQNENLNVIQGNVLDSNDVKKALEHQDAVIQCLGVGGKGNGKPTTFISDATKIIVEEMEKQQIKRLIAMSNVGAGNSLAFQPWFFTKIILPYFMKWLKVIIDDKNRMEPIMMNSELDWTIVRCPNIVEKTPKGNVHATLDGKGLKFRHPSYFDEYRTAMLEIYPDEVKSDDEYWKDFYWMAFKIEIRKGLMYSFLNSEHLDPIRSEIERDSC